jgi:RimJ/RimL family protein N-acetyltransferase
MGLRHNQAMNGVDLHLRPFEETDLEMFERFAKDPSFSAPFEWSGFRSAASFSQRWTEDGFLEKDPHFVVVAEESALGWVMWERPYRGVGRSDVWVIGILFALEHRGRGVGTSAHRLLVDHLFDTTTAHRICAFTEAENLAEQKALEKCGFRREGVLRQSGFVRGDWRDVAIYGILRCERLTQ